ncbi:3-hydroxyacyl-CoA dehydrogenase NAD-binding domain-containing protein, partial [Nocardia sp. NPDC003345]
MSKTIPTDDSSAAVRYEVHGGLAVIQIANPPVNGLGDTVRAGIVAAVAAAEDSEARAIVLVGDGKGFSGGADLRQFGTPAAAAAPALPDVLTAIVRASKPVLAAIHGFALGGGLELALACHYRIADSDAKLGLPEVDVGLIPGSGGTQRLPRLIGASAALEMIQRGTPVSGVEAVALGLVDATFDGPALTAALKFFAERSPVAPPSPVVDTGVADATGIDFDARRRAVRTNVRNGLAQRTAIDAVEAATRLSLSDGLAFERAAFLELLAGPESAALRHVFLAEKSAAKATGDLAGTAPRPIGRVAVVGAGTMGCGIAMAFANGGLPVTVIEQYEDALERGMARIRATYDASVAKGTLTAAGASERIALIETSMRFDAAAAADLVVEAVFEDMEVKKQVFATLDACCAPGTILASNTSRLDLDEIAGCTSRPHEVIGLHFFSPANIMKLVEVVRAETTANDVVVTGLRLATRIGKIPVLSKVCEGFIGNRMLTP